MADAEASMGLTEDRLSPFAYRTALDGIRGLAALAVVLFHANTPGFSRGYAGVDVFFVLTGFLLGSLLVRELAEKKRVNLADFYFRRMRRLLPLSLFVLVISAFAHKLFSNPLAVMEHRQSFVAAALYHANWRMLFDSADYFATDKVSPVQHYWSLSAEEQMSLAFPILLWTFMALTGFRPKSWLTIFLLSFLVILSATWALMISSEFPMWAYLGTLERSYQLLAGAVVSLLTLIVEFPKWNQRIATIVSSISIFGYIFLGLDLGLNSIHVGILSCSFTVLLIASLEANPHSLIDLFLSHPILRKMGELSYGVYLWHFPILIIGEAVGFSKFQPARTVLLVLLSYAVAYPTHRFIEDPIRRYSTDRKALFLAFGLSLSIIVAVFAWNLLLGNETVQQLYNNAHVSSNDGLKPTEDLEDLTPTLTPTLTLTPNTTQISTNTPISQTPTQVNTTTLILSPTVTKPFPTFLLAGDSMTDRWQFVFKGLHVDGVKFNYFINWASACPWWWAEDYWNPWGSLKTRCYRMQDAITGNLTLRKIDILFLFSWGISRDLNSEHIPVSDPRWALIVEKGIRISLKKWVNHTQVVLVLPFDVPKTSIPDCLAQSAGRDSCDKPAAPWPYHDMYRDLLIRSAKEFNLAYVDVKTFFCPKGRCKAFTSKGKPTWSDFAHQSDDFMREPGHKEKLKIALMKSCIDLDRRSVTLPCPTLDYNSTTVFEFD